MTSDSGSSIDEYLPELEDDVDEFRHAYCRSAASICREFLDEYLPYGRERTLLEIELADIFEDSSDKIAAALEGACSGRSRRKGLGDGGDRERAGP
jgi:hypothetical protein